MNFSKPAIVTGIILGSILVIGLWVGGNYNSLVTSKNAVDNSWSKVETQYQRRFDLIDNLVASTKGAQVQEQKVFLGIAEARTAYAKASTTNDKVAAAQQIDTQIALIPRLQEAYPELKSNQQVQSLMNELTGTENNIASARNDFNDTATNYNNNITRFPKSLFAGAFNFEKQSLFKADVGASKAVKVNLQ